MKCPRCGLPSAPDGRDQLDHQVRNCDYCATRYKNQNFGQPTAEENTHKTWDESQGVR